MPGDSSAFGRRAAFVVESDARRSKRIRCLVIVNAADRILAGHVLGAAHEEDVAIWRRDHHAIRRLPRR